MIQAIRAMFAISTMIFMEEPLAESLASNLTESIQGHHEINSVRAVAYSVINA